MTNRPLASAGLSEAEAKRLGIHFTVQSVNTGTGYSSRRAGEQYSAFKVLVEEGSGRILGAHVLGDRAEEEIHVFSLAIQYML